MVYASNTVKISRHTEFDSLTRLGFPDPKATVIRQMRGWSDVVMLSSCCVGHNIVDQLSASIEDALHSKTWVDAKVGMLE